MKKAIVFIFTAALLLSLCACSFNGARPALTPSPSPAEQALPASTGNEELQSILNELVQNIQPGSAGSSLKSVQQAVRLINWGLSATMSENEITGLLKGHMSQLSDAQRGEFLMAMELFESSYRQLLTPGQQELLESAGCGESGYPWGDQPIDNIEILFRALS